jgi:hypothetical protein
MKGYVDWFIENKEPGNLCDPPLDPQLALLFLCDYLLGEKWSVVMPESQKQVNSAIVDEILFKYSKRYRKEVKEYGKKLQN